MRVSCRRRCRNINAATPLWIILELLTALNIVAAVVALAVLRPMRRRAMEQG